MKPFQVSTIDYAAAAAFNRATHRHLPIPPPMVQIRACFAIVWRGQIRAVAMLGNTVSPHLTRSHWEVRRLASDGLYGACSALYRACVEYTHAANRDLVTYTLSHESGRSLVISGAILVHESRTCADTRRGRLNLTNGVKKHRWEWRREN